VTACYFVSYPFVCGWNKFC